MMNEKKQSAVKRILGTRGMGAVITAFAGLIIIPLHLVLSTHYPGLLGFWGTSTSWLSVFMIIVLMIILITTMLWRRFKKS